MRSSIFLKALLLIIALVGVIYAMRSLSPDKLEGALSAVGVEPGPGGTLNPSQRPLAAGEERYNICPTRVHSIQWVGGPKIEEVKKGLNLRWFAYVPESRELNYMATEKWLSSHCQIIVSPVAEPGAAFADFLVIEYINGAQLRVERAVGPIYRIGDDTFRSDDFSQALGELADIGGFPNPGTSEPSESQQ